MSEQKCFYEILGVAKDASDKDITKARRTAARKWHPDKFHQKSEEEQTAAADHMSDANRAHDVLSDPDKRDAYDRGGFEALANFENGGGSSQSSTATWDDTVAHFSQNSDDMETAAERLKRRQAEKAASGNPTAKKAEKPWMKKRQDKKDGTTQSSDFNNTANAANNDSKQESKAEVVMVSVPSDVLQQVCDELRKDNARTSLASKIESCMTRQGVKPGRKWNF